MFEVGEKVVYPNHGVSVVEEISTASFHDLDQVLFHLRLLSNNSKVMVPKENLELVGLRPLCDKTEIQELVETLQNGLIDTYKDWKGRYKQNLDKMKTGQLTEVAEVLKNLRLVSQKKSLSFREKKMYERAKYFIVSEIAQVREIDDEEARSLVEESLETSLEKLRQSIAAKIESENETAESNDEAEAEAAPVAQPEIVVNKKEPAAEKSEKADAAKAVKKVAAHQPAADEADDKTVAVKKPASTSRRKAS